MLFLQGWNGVHFVSGSFVAVGSMEPVIEIWDLDLVDSVEPATVLGTKAKSKGKKVAAVILHSNQGQVKRQKGSSSSTA